MPATAAATVSDRVTPIIVVHPLEFFTKPTTLSFRADQLHQPWIYIYKLDDHVLGSTSVLCDTNQQTNNLQTVIYDNIYDKESFERERVSKLVSWCFKPSQPQGITSGLREGGRGKEQRAEYRVSEDRRGDREWRTSKWIDIRKTSLKTDGETVSGKPTQ